MSQTLSVELSNNTIEIFDLLSKRTKRTSSDLLEEALANFFQEYKEILLDG